MIWTICIASVWERHELLNRLLDHLLPQCESFDDVEVLAAIDNGEITIGEKRNRLLSEATGEYVSFIDDDDLIPDHHVATLRSAMVEDRPDYIGFVLQMFWKHEDKWIQQKPTFHSIEHRVWRDDENGYYRGVEPKNPIRTSVARTATFPHISCGEDEAWGRQILERNPSMTEKFVPSVMYLYLFDPDTSTTQTKVTAATPVPVREHSHLRVI